MLVRPEQGPAEALHQVSLHGGCLSLSGSQRPSVVLLGRIEIPLSICRFGGELWLDFARVPLQKERKYALNYGSMHHSLQVTEKMRK